MTVTLGHLLAAHVTPANERAQVRRLYEDVAQSTGHAVKVGKADQSCTGAEWWSVASAGCRDSEDSRGTMSDYPKCSPGCISYSLPCSCCPPLHGAICGGKFTTRSEAAPLLGIDCPQRLLDRSACK